MLEILQPYVSGFYIGVGITVVVYVVWMVVMVTVRSVAAALWGRGK